MGIFTAQKWADIINQGPFLFFCRVGEPFTSTLLGKAQACVFLKLPRRFQCTARVKNYGFRHAFHLHDKARPHDKKR